MIVNIFYYMKIEGLNQELILNKFNIRRVSQQKLGVGEAIGEELQLLAWNRASVPKTKRCKILIGEILTLEDFTNDPITLDRPQNGYPKGVRYQEGHKFSLVDQEEESA